MIDEWTPEQIAQMPTPEEVNALIENFTVIKTKLEELQIRDARHSDDYADALIHLKLTWKVLYRMGVRRSILEK